MAEPNKAPPSSPAAPAARPFVAMIRPDGTPTTVHPDDVTKAESQGFLPDTPERQAERRVAEQGLGGELATFAEGAAKGLQLGGLVDIPGVIGGEAYRQRRAERAEASPGLSTFGEILGTVAPAIVAPGAAGTRGLAGKALAATPTGLATRLATKAGARAAARAPQGARAAAEFATAGAVEGAAYGVGQAVDEQRVHGGDPDKFAQKLFVAGLEGGALGGFLGGGLGGLSDAARAGVKAVTKGRSAAELLRGLNTKQSLGAFNPTAKQLRSLSPERKAKIEAVIEELDAPRAAGATPEEHEVYAQGLKQKYGKQIGDTIEALDRRAGEIAEPQRILNTLDEEIARTRQANLSAAPAAATDDAIEAVNDLGLENTKFLRTGYREESKDYIRKFYDEGREAELPPIVVDLLPPEAELAAQYTRRGYGVALQDGRHRLQVAQERGLKTVRGNIRVLDDGLDPIRTIENVEIPIQPRPAGAEASAPPVAPSAAAPRTASALEEATETLRAKAATTGTLTYDDIAEAAARLSPEQADALYEVAGAKRYISPEDTNKLVNHLENLAARLEAETGADAQQLAAQLRRELAVLEPHIQREGSLGLAEPINAFEIPRAQPPVAAPAAQPPGLPAPGDIGIYGLTAKQIKQMAKEGRVENLRQLALRLDAIDGGALRAAPASTRYTRARELKADAGARLEAITKQFDDFAPDEVQALKQKYKEALAELEKEPLNNKALTRSVVHDLKNALPAEGVPSFARVQKIASGFGQKAADARAAGKFTRAKIYDDLKHATENTRQGAIESRLGVEALAEYRAARQAYGDAATLERASELKLGKATKQAKAAPPTKPQAEPLPPERIVIPAAPRPLGPVILSDLQYQNVAQLRRSLAAKPKLREALTEVDNFIEHGIRADLGDPALERFRKAKITEEAADFIEKAALANKGKTPKGALQRIFGGGPGGAAAGIAAAAVGDQLVGSALGAVGLGAAGFLAARAAKPLLSAGSEKLLALANRTQNLDAKIARSVERAFGGASRGTRAAIQAFSTDRALERQPGETRAEAYERVRKNVQEAIESNPEPRYADIAAVAPDTAAALQKTEMTALNFLSKKLGGPPDPNSFNPLLKRLTNTPPPTPDQIRRGAIYVDTVQNPERVLEALADGSLAHEQAEALHEIAPALFAQIRATAFSHLATSKTDLPYARRVKLALLLDLPLEPSLKIPLVHEVQRLAYPPPEEAQRKPQGGGGGLGDRTATLNSVAQRLESEGLEGI